MPCSKEYVYQNGYAENTLNTSVPTVLIQIPLQTISTPVDGDAI